MVEDIKAASRKKARKWNALFSPLQVGKAWFYEHLANLGRVLTVQGYETAEMRQELGLKKTSRKMVNVFEAHCIDSWVLANNYVGGHAKPDNKEILRVIPLRFKRRQLHRQLPAKGGVRKREGTTRSLGFKRGSLVEHVKYGLCYVGGWMKDRITLHSLETAERVARNVKPADCRFKCYLSWRLVNV